MCVCSRLVVCTSTPPQVMEEKINSDFIEVVSVTEQGYKSYNKAALDAILGRI